jgi:hypothetical protein
MNIRSTRLALALATLLAGVAQAQSVTPPPLPIGSQLARPDPGMSEPERKRAVRAHHHKFHHGKDVTRDDSVHGHESLSPDAVRPVVTRAPAAGVSGSTGSAGAGSMGAAAPSAQGGAGTGPGREKTDRGASSYFFGNDKK